MLNIPFSNHNLHNVRPTNPPVTPDRNSFVNFANNIAENPHTYSLTPLQLLPKRLSHCLQQVRQGPQLLVVLDEPEIIKAAPRLQNAMWGIDNDDTTERAEAAAILEAAVCRWLVSGVDREMIARWLSDDERLSGRVYDRLWDIETARLIPWRFADPGYNGPSLVYDVLVGRVRRLQIQDFGRFKDAEDNLGVWGKEMEITNARGVESEDEEEAEDIDTEEEEDSDEDSEEESEDEELEGDDMDEDE